MAIRRTVFFIYVGEWVNRRFHRVNRQFQGDNRQTRLFESKKSGNEPAENILA